jgi:hypothetical protein
VDDCKISHEVPQVIDETINWLKAKYESIFEDGSGEMKVHRGKVFFFKGFKGYPCYSVGPNMFRFCTRHDIYVEFPVWVNSKHTIKELGELS